MSSSRSRQAKHKDLAPAPGEVGRHRATTIIPGGHSARTWRGLARVVCGLHLTVLLAGCGAGNDTTQPAATTTTATTTVQTTFSTIPPAAVQCAATATALADGIMASVNTWERPVLERVRAAANALERPERQLATGAIADAERGIAQSKAGLVTFKAAACGGQWPDRVIVCMEVYRASVAPLAESIDRDAPARAQISERTADSMTGELAAAARYQARLHEFTSRAGALSQRAAFLARCALDGR